MAREYRQTSRVSVNFIDICLLLIGINWLWGRDNFEDFALVGYCAM